jgi:hypothetical protein
LSKLTIDNYTDNQEALLFYLSKIFDIDYSIINEKYFSDIFNLCVNLRSIEDLRLDSSNLLTILFPIETIISTIEIFISKHISYYNNDKNETNIDIKSLFAKDFKERENQFWLCSYFLDHLKVSAYSLLKVYHCTITNNNYSNQIDYNHHFIYTQCYLIYRLLKNVELFESIKFSKKSNNICIDESLGNSLFIDYSYFLSNHEFIRKILAHYHKHLTSTSSELIYKLESNSGILSTIKQVEDMFEKKLNILSKQDQTNESTHRHSISFSTLNNSFKSNQFNNAYNKDSYIQKNKTEETRNLANRNTTVETDLQNSKHFFSTKEFSHMKTKNVPLVINEKSYLNSNLSRNNNISRFNQNKKYELSKVDEEDNVILNKP